MRGTAHEAAWVGVRGCGGGGCRCQAHTSQSQVRRLARVTTHGTRRALPHNGDAAMHESSVPARRRHRLCALACLRCAETESHPYAGPASPVCSLRPRVGPRSFVRRVHRRTTDPGGTKNTDTATSWRVSLGDGRASAKKTISVMRPCAASLGCISYEQALRHVACRVHAAQMRRYLIQHICLLETWSGIGISSSSISSLAYRPTCSP